MDIKFHCDAKNNFTNEYHQIRAFLYSDYSIEPHNHDFYEVNIIFGGSGTHIIENARIMVKPGDVFVIPPMTVHAYYDTQNLDVYHILIHKDFIYSNQEEASAVPGFLQLIEIEPFLRRHFPKKTFLHLTHGQLMQLKSDLTFIEDHNPYDTDDLYTLKKHTLWKVLYWLSALLHNQMYTDSEHNSGKHDIAIFRILEFIHHNYDSKITINSLNQKTFLSRSTFLRNFFNICGCTPMEYVNRYRCKRALEMLDNSSLSKTEIAHCCGFYDLSHMERTLKRFGRQ